MKYEFETRDLLLENLQLIFHLFESEAYKSKKQLLAIICKVNGWSSNNFKCYHYYNQFIKDRFYDEKLNQLLNKV